MAKYYLTLGDRDKVQATITRVNGGSGNNRPLARRRRFLINEQSPQVINAVLGTAVQNVLATDETFTLDNLDAFLGAIPKDEAGVPVATLEVQNWFGWDLTAGARVLAVHGFDWIDDDGKRWLAVQAECP